MNIWTFMVMTQEKDIGPTKNDVVFVLPPNNPIRGKDTLKYYQPVRIELPDDVGKEYMERKVRPNAQFEFNIVGDSPEQELMNAVALSEQKKLPVYGLTVDIETDLGLSVQEVGRAKSLKCDCVPVHATIDIIKVKET